MKGRAGRILRALLPGSLRGQMILLLGLLVLVQIGISGVIYGSLVADFLADQIGRRALDIAATVAATPLVAAGVATGDPDRTVQAFAEEVRARTGAEYVVVCDRAGRRLSHPDPWKIGEHFVGGDEQRVLAEGASYVSRGVGTLGPSLRGFVPVRDAAGDVVGFVAVGYLVEDVDRTIVRHQLQPRVFVFMMALVGLLGAVVIADFFKRAILGLEPREIAALYRERSAMLETIREGVVAVDAEGAIRLANAAARRDLGLAGTDGHDGAGLAGRPVGEVAPEIPVAEVLGTGVPVLDYPLERGGTALVGNVLPVRHGGDVVGVVASFRRRDELDRLARELSQVREYAELLRAQAHEHSNQLHTIAGLIQVGAHREALDLILAESADYQAVVSRVEAAVGHPLLTGLILGKIARAGEMKVALEVDPDSSLHEVPDHIAPERLVTVLGNLLDNAIEAAAGGEARPARVRLSMTDLGRDLVLEVEDSGPGVPDADAERIFTAGVTTKKEAGHGIGLALVVRHLEAVGGHALVGHGDLGGALFTAVIPKKEAGSP